MTTTENEKADAGFAQAEYDARAVGELAAAEPDTMPLVDAVQALLFHPRMTPNEKVLTMQLVWIGEPMSAADLSKGSRLTPLAVQFALRRMMALGIVDSRFVLTDQKTGQTTRIFELKEENRGKLGDVPDLPETKDKAPEAVDEKVTTSDEPTL